MAKERRDPGPKKPAPPKPDRPRRPAKPKSQAEIRQDAQELMRNLSFPS